MTRAIHGAPAEALRRALEALSQLSFWIASPAEAYRDGSPVDMMDKPLRASPTSPQAQQQQKDRFKRILAA